MATVSGYITDKLSRYQMALSSNEVEALLAEHGLTPTDDYTADNAVLVNTVFVGVLPEILAMPSVSEDSYSVKYNTEGLYALARFLCAKYGIAYPFEENNTISNASNIW